MLAEYIKENFYDKIYIASKSYFLDNLENLGISNDFNEDIEVVDMDIMRVYAGQHDGHEIAIDVLANLYASVTQRNNHFEDTNEMNHWVRVKCFARPEAGLKDFRIIGVDSYEKGESNLFKQPLSDRLVPIFRKDDLDGVADNFLKKYDPNSLLTPTQIDTEYIVQQMGLQLKYASITEDTSIFGQIYFRDNLDKNILSGTIVVDDRLQHLRGGGVVRNTIIHECIHWELHRYALELARIKEENLSVLSTTNSMKDEYTSDMIEWMEWHAEAIAPRVLMPKEMFTQEAKARYQRLIELSETKDELEIIERWIDDLSFFFGVSKLSAKVRLVECGFEIVKGAYIYLDNQYVPPHKWREGYLEDNHTFSVDLIQLGLQLLAQPHLKKKVDHGQLLYVESHLCINDSRYISYDIAGNPFLTSYARHHMEECCIVFELIPKFNVGKSSSLTLLLNRDAGSDIQYTINYPDDKNDSVEQIVVHIDDLLEIMAKLNGLDSFGPALKEVMVWRDFKNRELADVSFLGLETISKLRNGKTEPKLESIIAICIGMKLPPTVSEKLIELSGRTLRNGNRLEMYYKFILSASSSLDVTRCNALLVKQGFKELVHNRDA